ncbi:uncharacterized protein CANTADRAFT_25486 [Suhomyces tanzawaensis NRRL Y-17324]|uniref:Uncharacterized protein n=1 Tax=Suhomyces tanzawaensis NRRL Y-17324 TaxID=984487 RepID=A0A1E4SP66_9ASCO|nr:uncharacterized protein CANTADRAFT_25486 [Suhomyces tanzawaensis NRRL Y-17324]ODV81295.1 hypothetical protein CANTADRAFT_25486 [Suhomyces tanzawaensis NRRL Y-17324]
MAVRCRSHVMLEVLNSAFPPRSSSTNGWPWSSTGNAENDRVPNRDEMNLAVYASQNLPSNRPKGASIA